MKKSLFALLLVAVIATITGCGKEEAEYGDISGMASGTVSINGDMLDIDIKDINAETGTEIDYTTGIAVDGVTEDDYFEIQADASGVDTGNAGTYDVKYKIIYEDNVYSETAKVTISGESKENNSNVETTKNNNNEKQTNSSSANIVTEDKNSSDIETAEIELLSGEKITIEQTTSKYIVSTYTDNSEIKKGDITYSVSKLIIKFNTGETKVLETIERPVYK